MTEPEIIPPADKPKRPAEFTDEIFDTICERMTEGEGLRKICEDPEMPSRQTFLRWIEKDTGRQTKYTAAREALMDWYAEEILTIAWDDSKDTIKGWDGEPKCNHEWINRSRLKVDTLKFLMAKLHPKRYGDKTPDMEADRELKISWQKNERNGEDIHEIRRIIISGPVVGDDGKPIDEKQALEARIRELEDRLAGREAPARPADKPLAITYDPAPPPADLTPEAWSAIARVSELIEQIAPSETAPEHAFGLIEGFLRSHFLNGGKIDSVSDLMQAIDGRTRSI